jgi:membrane-associated phospholipid phosphatase
MACSRIAFRVRSMLLLTAQVAALGFSAGSVSAQGADSATVQHGVLSRTDAYILGGFTAAFLLARPLDVSVTRALQEPILQKNTVLGRTATVSRLLANPGSIVGTSLVYVVGSVRHDHSMADVGLHSMEAILVTNVITTTTKMVAGRARPYLDPTRPHDFQLFRGLRGNDYQSFPSGHTSTAFAVASALTAEAGQWRPGSRYIVGGVTYTLATMTGASRIYNERHWASDVVAGAAIGTLTGLAVVRWNHLHEDGGLNRRLLPRESAGPEIPIVLISIPGP